MKSWCVYCHISPAGKKYVGASCSAVSRWSNGNGYKKNYKFWPDIEEYGWDNFQHVILHEGLSKSAAKEIERRLIEEWNLLDSKYGYNLSGSGAGKGVSKETQLLFSKSRRGNKNSAGRSLSQETREKISKSLVAYYKTHPGTMTGRKLTEDQIRALKQRTFSAETRRKMSEHRPDISGEKNPSARAVRQLALNGDVIAEYSYAKAAAQKLNLDLSSIIRCCRGKAKTCGGYRWEYI